MLTTNYFESTEFIIRQQFHHKGNIICDRINKRKILIPSSDEIVDKIINSINSVTYLFESNEKDWFIKHVSNFLKLPVKQVLDLIQEKKELMKEIMENEREVDPILLYLTLFGAVMGFFRKFCYDEVISLLKTNKKQFKDLNDEKIDILLNRFYYEESLLANIVILTKFAEIVKTPIDHNFLKKELSEAISRIPKEIKKIIIN